MPTWRPKLLQDNPGRGFEFHIDSDDAPVVFEDRFSVGFLILIQGSKVTMNKMI